jgi:hypothetical protein
LEGVLGNRGRSSGKTAVIGVVSRKANVVARVLGRMSKKATQAFVRERVSTKVNLLATDENFAYVSMKDYPR